MSQLFLGFQALYMCSHSVNALERDVVNFRVAITEMYPRTPFGSAENILGTAGADN
jgi:hypothetical protein